MSRLSSNLYAVCSLDPIVDDVETVGLDGSPFVLQVMACLPLDFTAGEVVDNGTRYVSLVIVPVGLSGMQILPCFDTCRAYSSQWVSYMWEV